MKLLLITAIVTLAGLAVEAWHQPHYFAPMTCVIYAIVIQGLRHLRSGSERALSSDEHSSR